MAIIVVKIKNLKKTERHGVGVEVEEPTIKKITFIFQNEPFLLLTGYLEFHFRSQGKSGKSQGIPSWKKSGNPVHVSSAACHFFRKIFIGICITIASGGVLRHFTMICPQPCFPLPCFPQPHVPQPHVPRVGWEGCGDCSIRLQYSQLVKMHSKFVGFRTNVGISIFKFYFKI